MKPMEEFAYFGGIILKEIPSWKDVEACLLYLIDKGVDVNDAKCFDQICNLKQCMESYLQDEECLILNCQRIRNGANISISLRTSHPTQKL